MKEFTHLHLHTVHSLLDGFTKIDDLVKVVGQHKMKAVAITDHGNMSGVPYLFQEAHANGIKPIAGIEAYICEDVTVRGGGRDQKAPYYHITLLARSSLGYRNLCKLSTLSWTEGFYAKPRVDPTMLAMYAEDVICLTGCVGGWPAAKFLAGDEAGARDALGQLRSIFGRIYAELTWTGEPAQKKYNAWLIKQAQKDGLKLVATGDSHYTWKEQSDDHDTLFAMGLHKKKAEPERLKFIPHQYYVKSAQEMYALGLPESAVRNSMEIEEMCELYELPRAGGIPAPVNAYDKICELASTGLVERVPEIMSDPAEPYTDRLLMELETIKSLNYEGYFLVAYEICEFARQNKIGSGWGRGSAAGSLLSYCLGITHIDPVKHGLYFERFLNSSRKEPPDIDLDFTDTERPLIVDFLRSKYGEDAVSHIGTFGTLGPRQVIIDASKAFEKDESLVKMALEAIPHDPTLKVQDILDNEGWSGHIKTVLGDEVLHAMEVFQGIPRSASIHAAGFIVDTSNLSDSLPFMVARNGEQTSQYDYDALKMLGFEKFDVLGVRTLRVIHDCCRMVDVDPYTVDVRDSPTYDLLGRGDTMGIFQLEGYGYRTFLQKFKPRNFYDIMMISALYRPGPMQGGKGLDEIIARRFGRAEVKYLHSSLEQILKPTYGVMVFQEQVMAVVRILAGWDLTTADLLRSAIGKKKIDDVKGFRTRFVGDCMRKGHKQKFAEEAFTQIEYFSRYGWNKAHAAAYGMVTYVTAFLKAHHRREFMLALLNSEVGNHEKIIKLCKDVVKSGIKLYSPHINLSESNFQLHDSGILLGLSGIKGLGEKAPAFIIEERKRSGKFSSWRDFEVRIPRKNVNSLMRRILDEQGAFRGLEKERNDDHVF